MQTQIQRKGTPASKLQFVTSGCRACRLSLKLWMVEARGPWFGTI